MPARTPSLPAATGGALLPERSEIVIIGGGVIGCAIAWQLTQRGKTDVTVIERRRLTEGTTWHAAGLVGQLRSTASLTGLMRAGVQTYAGLERLTGYATGWRPVGSVRVAASDGRWAELQRHAGVARSVGLEAHLISAGQARELFPLLSTDGVRGAVWVPSDGHADPSQLTHSFAAGARAGGARFAENCLVQAIEQDGRRVSALVTNHGRIHCDIAVNATGMWARQTGRLAGAGLAVGAVEHQYVVTEQIAGLPPTLPTCGIRTRGSISSLRPAHCCSAAGKMAPGCPGPSRPHSSAPLYSRRTTSGSNNSARRPCAGSRRSRRPASAPGSTGRYRSRRTPSR